MSHNKSGRYATLREEMGNLLCDIMRRSYISDREGIMYEPSM